MARSAVELSRPGVYAGILLVAWYGAGIMGVITNKSLLAIFPHPMVLTSMHVMAGLVLDYFIVFYRSGEKPKLWNRSIIIKSLPIMVLLLLGKSMTYLSYEKIAASLTHTIKASSPVFNVLLTYAISQKLPRISTIAALFTITLGVVLTARADQRLDSELYGILAALLACFSGALQTIYTKMLLTRIKHMDVILLHFYASVAALLLLWPYILFQIGSWLTGHRKFAMEAASSHQVTLYLAGSVCCHYTQNISSMLFLSLVPALTHQVVGTCRRVVNIVGSILWFGNSVSGMEGLGIFTTLLGFSWYSISRGGVVRSKASKLAHKAEDDFANPDPATDFDTDLEQGHPAHHDHNHQKQMTGYTPRASPDAPVVRRLVI